jgi:hypothetical protein
LPTPSHQSDTFLYQTMGSAPSPVESAVTQPYHHTCAALRPLTWSGVQAARAEQVGRWACAGLLGVRGSE